MKRILVLGLLLLSSSVFSFQTKDTTRTEEDSKKHVLYIEPQVFGGIFTLGYSYDFLTLNKLKLSSEIGIGGVLQFNNPTTAFYIPFGIGAKYHLKKRTFGAIGISNFYYLNYWANFTEEGKDCTGMLLCPPDRDPLLLMPYVGTSFEYRKLSLEPRVYFSFFAWWDAIYPLPALRLKLKL